MTIKPLVRSESLATQVCKEVILIFHTGSFPPVLCVSLPLFPLSSLSLWPVATAPFLSSHSTTAYQFLDVLYSPKVAGILWTGDKEGSLMSQAHGINGETCVVTNVWQDLIGKDVNWSAWEGRRERGKREGRREGGEKGGEGGRERGGERGRRGWDSGRLKQSRNTTGRGQHSQCSNTALLIRYW